MKVRRSKMKMTHAILICMTWAWGWAAAAAVAEPADAPRILKDVPYKPDAGSEYERERCKLDLYLPRQAEGFATVVWFHGGALEGGQKGDEISQAMGRRLTAAGIAVASVNYRLHPKVRYPAYVEDAAAAFAFIHREIARYGGSPKRVFISGHSAGGYLAAMMAIDERRLHRHDLKLSDVAGAMPVSGQMITHSTIRRERGVPESQPVIDEAAPAFHALSDAPPFLLIAGGDDLPARAEENRYFAAALKAAGHKHVTFLEVAGRDHNSIASRVGEPGDAVAKAMIAFIEHPASR